MSDEKLCKGAWVQPVQHIKYFTLLCLDCPRPAVHCKMPVSCGESTRGGVWCSLWWSLLPTHLFWSRCVHFRSVLFKESVLWYLQFFTFLLKNHFFPRPPSLSPISVTIALTITLTYPSTLGGDTLTPRRVSWRTLNFEMSCGENDSLNERGSGEKASFVGKKWKRRGKKYKCLLVLNYIFVVRGQQTKNWTITGSVRGRIHVWLFWLVLYKEFERMGTELHCICSSTANRKSNSDRLSSRENSLPGVWREMHYAKIFSWATFPLDI